MTTDQLDALIERIRKQAKAWLDGETIDSIERLIAYVTILHAKRLREKAPK